MAKRYALLAEVRHDITDVVTLTVEAENETEAFDKAKECLEVFPRPVEYDGVRSCYIEHRVFNDTKVIKIENMERSDEEA